MRWPDRPQATVTQALTACTAGMQDHVEKQRLEGLLTQMQIAEASYLRCVGGTDLHALNTSPDLLKGQQPKDKEALVRAYDQGLVGRKDGRALYDSIMAAAPHGECPLCGTGEVDTLDHYMPKTVFPLCSIMPINLVPACMHCNHGKGAALAGSPDTQPLHPYVDQLGYERWLVADVLPTIPASVRFRVQARADWPPSLAARVRHHFDSYNLSLRYGQKAGRHLAGSRRDHARLLALGPDILRHALEEDAESWALTDPNAWETALYFGLASSEWYVNGGLLQV
ncbi:hypothetical protein [Streptomyces longwoodensis]|uniref:hypothetical protein n=1 Tax=Streptomyces longwoodensis TaxID=68231 RepID=UPI00224CB441|nr:hypothetical protein [Streptomyces longwoodensis]MCX5000891.1 hypothetical protein [Streptomyces longwoodensis]